MKNTAYSKTKRLLAGAPLLLGLAAIPAEGQWLTQEVPLREGWNAVYLHVVPYPASCDLQFAGTPVVEAHRYNQRVRVAQFDDDPSKPFPRPAEWLTWRPDQGENGHVRTLENLTGDTTYLIRSDAAVVLSIKGRPLLPRREWVARMPNLVGFQVDPAAGARPTFAEFFASEPGIPVAGGPDEGIVYEVDDGLRSIDLTSRARRRKIDPGVAFWVRSQVYSRFTGPIEIAGLDSQGLRFGTDRNELSFRIRNRSSEPVRVDLRHVLSANPPGGTLPLAAEAPLLVSWRSANGWEWQEWSVDGLRGRALGPEESWAVRVAVDRPKMNPAAPPEATWQSLIRVNGGGMQMHIPVSAERESGNAQSSKYPAGLWIGEALIDAVSYVVGPNDTTNASPSAPIPVRQPFPIRLIVHQDESGVARLLSEVLVVGRTNGSPENVEVSLIPGGTNRIPAGAVALARVTSPALGGAGVVNLTNLTNGVFLKTSVQGQFTLPPEHPLNPFRHLFHPQHTNGIALTHVLQLDWTASPVSHEPHAPLWNPEETASGALRQTVYGLRHAPIEMEGPFSLKRVSAVGALEGVP